MRENNPHLHFALKVELEINKCHDFLHYVEINNCSDDPFYQNKKTKD